MMWDKGDLSFSRNSITGFSDVGSGCRQNTDPQSMDYLMDYPDGLPRWTTLKWTTPKMDYL